jgi:protein-S-isoprenylcysteine O-methyltransferase Ste14
MILKFGEIFFKYRSYFPIPFLLIMIIFMDPYPASLIAGVLIAVAGESIRLWSVSYAGSETRTTSGVGGSNLVTQGPYSVVRNPLYIGNMMIYTGIGIMSNALFPYLQIFAFLYFLFQYYCIIRVEEEYLRKTYKENYEIYASFVNRFFPRIPNLPAEIRSNLNFKIRDGLRSEKRTLQAFLFSSLIIIIFFFFNIRIKDLF